MGQFRIAAESTEKRKRLHAGAVREGFLEEGSKLGLELLARFDVWMVLFFFFFSDFYKANLRKASPCV